jgi:hypothetical protein
MECIDDVKQEINDWNNFIFTRNKLKKELKEKDLQKRKEYLKRIEELHIDGIQKRKEHLKRLEELHKQARR